MFDLFEFFRTLEIIGYSRKTNSEYFELLSDEFKNTSIAGNFIPEAFDSTKQAFDSLKIIVEDLKIKDLRIGLRWDRIQTENQKIDLSFYLPFLEYCLKNKVKLCLNIGPIKTIGWPEEHIPQYILNNYGVEDLDLLKELAVDYLQKLLSSLDKEIGLSKEGLIYSLQPENESFNPFGQYKLSFDTDYLQKIVSFILNYYPDKEVMLDASGRDFVGKIFEFYDNFEGVNFAVGLNYYYTDPSRKSRIFKYIEPFAFSNFDNPTISEIKKIAKLRNYRLEVSEAQMDPWGEVQFPGNSAESLRYVLGKSVGLSDKTSEGKFKIRVWGLEHLTKQILSGEFTEERKKMVELLLKINLYNS